MARKIFYFGGAVISSECNDADATLYLDNSGITDQAIRKNICLTVKELKQQGVWNKIDVFYPDLGENADQNKLNVVNPLDTDGAFRRTFHGGVTFDPINGTKGNGTNGYYDTKYAPGIMVDEFTGMGITIGIGSNEMNGTDIGALVLSLYGNGCARITASGGIYSTTNRAYMSMLSPGPTGVQFPYDPPNDGILSVNRPPSSLTYFARRKQLELSLEADFRNVIDNSGALYIYGLGWNKYGSPSDFSPRSQKGVVIYKNATQANVIKIETALANMNSRR